MSVEKKVLIVDDEAHIRRILELKIKGAGYDVRGDTNGAAAYETAKTFVPDLIVSDLRMPGEMSGIDLIRAVRQTSRMRRTPIILLTGSVAVMEELKDSISDVEDVTLMSKPFSPRNLIKLIKELLQKSDDGEVHHD